MERTEIVSLQEQFPADGNVVTVCGWAKNIRDSQEHRLHRPCLTAAAFQDPAGRAEAGKLANYDEVVHTGLGTAACVSWAASC